MAILLSIETSTTFCSAALHQQGELLSFKESRIPQSTASQLAVMISELFTEAKRDQKELKGVVVASGPGSYTGLRIGVATAKGICYALQLPLISVNTLELLTYQLIHSGQLADVKIDASQVMLCPMLDARRMEVYCLVARPDLTIVEPTQAKVIDNASFSNYLDKQAVIFFGDGADKCKDTINYPNAKFIADIHPSAKALGEMGFIKWRDKAFEDLGTYEPFYLKDFLIRKPNLVS